MAADYWKSSQHRSWLFTRESLAQCRFLLDRQRNGAGGGEGGSSGGGSSSSSSSNTNSLAQHHQQQRQQQQQQHTLPEYRLLSIFFHQQLLRLMKRLHNPRQAPLATAQVYLRRFYTRVPVRQTNLYLMLATALYVAYKIEESSQNIRMVVAEARQLWPEFVGPDIASLGETEFRLISTMGCELIVHHPYTTLKYLETTFQLTPEEIGLAWSTVNDSYLTDLPLLCPPHVVAWAAVFIALTIKINGTMQTEGPAAGGNTNSVVEMVAATLKAGNEKGSTIPSPPPLIGGQQGRLHRFLRALADSEVDLTQVSDAVQDMVSLYVLWDTSFREAEIKDQVARFIKSHGLGK